MQPVRVTAELLGVRQKFGTPISAQANGELRFKCPQCDRRLGSPDLSGHLYLNLEKGCWNCYRCGYRGYLDKTDFVPDVPYSDSDLHDVLRSLRPSLTVDHPPTILTYPCAVRPIVEGSPAWHYLYARKMTTQRMQDYQLVWGYYMGADRVFFPVYSLSTGRMVYWMARKFQNVTADAKKYVNPSVPVGGNIFNLDRAINYDTVIITEGAISAISAGDNAVATLGKAVSEAQRETLLHCRFAEYIIALDGDARNNSVQLAKYLLDAGKQVSLVEIPVGHDPDSVDNFPELLHTRRTLNFAVLTELVSNAWHRPASTNTL